jgi:Holliday junction resolvase RusA-like endonuclease
MNAEIQKAIRKARKELRYPRQKALLISVPLTPPSVNHYKRPKSSGKGYYVTDEAKAFKAAISSLSKGSVEADAYFVGVLVYFGPGQRGDVGNLEKCIGDGLQDCGIMSNDSKTKKYGIEIDPERSGPRTDIFVCDLKDAPREDWVEFIKKGKPLVHAILLSDAAILDKGAKPGLCRRHGALYCRQCNGI